MTQILEDDQTEGNGFSPNYDGVYIITVEDHSGTVKLQTQNLAGDAWQDADRSGETDATWSGDGQSAVYMSAQIVYRMTASAAGPIAYIRPALINRTIQGDAIRSM